jgi:hypothetical protein
MREVAGSTPSLDFCISVDSYSYPVISLTQKGWMWSGNSLKLVLQGLLST